MPFLAGQELTAAQMEKIANVPRCRVLGTTAQSIPNSTFTAISFPEEVYKVNVGHDTGANPTFFSCSVAGLYFLTGGVYMATNSAGARALKWQKNGVDIPGSGNTAQPQGGIETPILARPIEVELAVTDFVQLLVLQASGGSLSTSVAADYTRPSMSIRLIRDNSL
jgi:hypothetical protein